MGLVDGGSKKALHRRKETRVPVGHSKEIGAPGPTAHVLHHPGSGPREPARLSWSLRKIVLVNHCGIHSVIRSGFATCIASCVLYVAKLLISEWDAAVIHDLLEAPLDGHF